MTREQFIAGYENWDNYKPLLWEGLERSNRYIIEMGTGKGSTELLHNYAKENFRNLFSYEADFNWWKTALIFASDEHVIQWTGAFENGWDYVNQLHGSDPRGFPGLVFIDHAPGERRKVDIALFANKAQIIVAHDTEPSADHGYQMRAEIAKFKYWRDFETDGAWTSIMSNFIDVTKPL